MLGIVEKHADQSMRAALIVAVLLAAPRPTHAQTLTTLYSFSGAQGSGSTQGPLVQGPDGLFYGAIQTGGADHDGAVFKITPSGVLTTLYSFSGADGKYPSSGVTLGIDGSYYGTAYLGGTSSDGSVFKITASGTFTVLHSFNGLDGEGPFAGLTLGPDGNFYGSTTGGGTHGYGTIFKITPSGTLATLYSFSGGASRPFPIGPVRALALGPDGNFYGATQADLVAGDNAIFRVTPTGTLTTIYRFSDAHVSPTGGVTLGPDGNFYGTTTYVNGANGAPGTTYGDCTIFSVTPTGALATLYTGALLNSTNSGLTGFGPAGGLMLGPDGNLYGMTSVGGTSSGGSLFRVTLAGVLTTLYSFSGADGEYPNSGLTLGSNGSLYGIASSGGTFNEGTIFSLSNFLPSTLPAISPAGTVPIYSTASTIQPGEWVSIYGSALATGAAVWDGNFPISLGGASVSIDGRAAFLWSVSPTQINLQAPDDSSTGTVPVVVTTVNGSATSTVTLGQFAPSFSLLDTKHVAGIILRSNGSGAQAGGTYDILGPTGDSLGYATVAAKAGDSVVLFGVGFGPTNPTVPAGQAYSGAAQTANTVQLSIGGTTVLPSFSGLSSAGLYQLNVTIPAGLGTGDLSLAATVGGVQTQPGVVMALQ